MQKPAPLPSCDGSDARLRALTEHALEIITVQNADGTFTYANEAVVRYLGYSVSELLGRNAAEFLHPDDADAMRERFRGVPERERRPAGTESLRIPLSPSRWQLVLARERGGQRARQSRGARHHRALARHQPPQGQRTHPVAESRALSHRRRPVRRRGVRIPHECAGRVRARMDAWAPNASMAAAKRNTGAAAGRAFSMGDGLAANRASRAPNVTCAAKPWNSPRRSGAPTAQLRWVEVKNRPIADPATGKFTRLVGVAIDITERKQAADALRESEFRYRTVAELTSGFVYESTVDEHGEAQVVWASPGWEQFFGGTFEELNRLGWRHVFFPADHAGRHPAPPAAAQRRTHRDGAGAEDAARRDALGSPRQPADVRRRRQGRPLHRRGARHHRPQGQRRSAAQPGAGHRSHARGRRAVRQRRHHPHDQPGVRSHVPHRRRIADRQASRPAALRSAARPAHRRIRRRSRGPRRRAAGERTHGARRAGRRQPRCSSKRPSPRWCCAASASG